MINKKNWQNINTQIEQALKQPFSITNVRSVSGGSINTAYVLEGANKSFFIKLNERHLLPMFEAEFAGLEEINQTKTIKVPHPIVTGTFANSAFLVLEMISLKSGTSQSDHVLGQNLAALHSIQQDYYGWFQDNTIGSTKQINHKTDNWVSFWREYRLNYQLKLAESNGYGRKLMQSGEKLSESLDNFFSNYQPQASLLHGDLWGGNAAATEQNEPIIYDPASYYGDRETDIAMTELFGGFSTHFYAAYNEVYPLHSDYAIRKTLYKLYHILNHLNLFGSGYLNQAQHMIDSLLAEITN